MAIMGLGDGRQATGAIRRGLDVLAIVVTGLCAAIVVSGTSAMILRSWTPVPYADQWFDMLSRQRLTWSFLFAQHNEHRILFPRLVFALDHWLAAETYTVDLAVSVVLQAASVVLIAGLCRRGRPGPPVTRLLCLFVTTTTLFSAMQYDNFLCGYQVQFFGVFTAGLAALWAVVALRSNVTAFAAFALFATVATFTLANGLLCAYAAVPVAILCRRPPWVTIVIAVMAVGLTGLYLIGYVSPVQHRDPLLSLRNPLSTVIYSATEIGSVLSVLVPGLPRWAATAAGLSAYAVCGLWFLRLLRRDSPGPEVLAFGIAAFLLATSLITAAGRAGLQPDYEFVSRYSTPVLLFWTVLLVTAVAKTSSKRSLFAVPALLVCVIWSLAIAHVQASLERTAVADKRALAAAAPAILARVPDWALLHRSDPFDTGVTIKWQPFLKAGRTSVFAPNWTRLQATDMPKLDIPACAQDEFQSAYVGSPEQTGWRLTGRLPDNKGEDLHILLFNVKGEAVGFGLGGFDGASVGRGVSESWARGDWWIGETSVGPQGLNGYVLGNNHRATCKLLF